MISLFAHEERDAKRQSLNDPLALLARHIDFAAIAAAVDAKLTLGPSGRGGRPPYPTVVVVKLLLLQQLYNLSDDALEYQVLDRTSFQRFEQQASTNSIRSKPNPSRITLKRDSHPDRPFFA